MKKNSKQILIFFVLTCLQLITLCTLYYMNKSDIILEVLMLTPLFSVILTKVITHEKGSNLQLKIYFKKNVRWYLFSWIGIILIAFSGSVLYFIFFPNTFNPLESIFANQNNITNTKDYFKDFMTLIPLAILINPIFGIPFCFGEEFAWRGYLLPLFTEKFDKRISAIIVSFIWGLWHTPIIWMGFNYGKEKSILAIVMQIILCFSLGFIFSYLYFKTKSIWPAVIAHASINAIDKFTPEFLFASSKQSLNLFIGPNLTGIVGGVGLLIVGLICLLKMNDIDEY